TSANRSGSQRRDDAFEPGNTPTGPEPPASPEYAGPTSSDHRRRSESGTRSRGVGGAAGRSPVTRYQYAALRCKPSSPPRGIGSGRNRRRRSVAVPRRARTPPAAKRSAEENDGVSSTPRAYRRPRSARTARQNPRRPRSTARSRDPNPASSSNGARGRTTSTSAAPAASSAGSAINRSP